MNGWLGAHTVFSLILLFLSLLDLCIRSYWFGESWVDHGVVWDTLGLRNFLFWRGQPLRTRCHGGDCVVLHSFLRHMLGCSCHLCHWPNFCGFYLSPLEYMGALHHGIQGKPCYFHLFLLSFYCNFLILLITNTMPQGSLHSEHTQMHFLPLKAILTAYVTGCWYMYCMHSKHLYSKRSPWMALWSLFYEPMQN